MRSEARHPDRVRHDAMGTDCFQCVRRTPPEGQLLDQEPVGHDLIMRGRRHDELASGFVVRVIDHRQPLPRVVRPVLAERRALAVDVVDQSQAAAGHTAVRRRDRQFLARLRWLRQDDPESIALVRELQGLAARRHAGHRHPFFTSRGNEIECDLGDARRGETNRGRAVAGYPVVGVGDRQPKHVVNGVHTGLTWVGVGTGRGAAAAVISAIRNTGTNDMPRMPRSILASC
jgi:hypothetical protein